MMRLALTMEGTILLAWVLMWCDQLLQGPATMSPLPRWTYSNGERNRYTQLSMLFALHPTFEPKIQYGIWHRRKFPLACWLLGEKGWWRGATLAWGLTVNAVSWDAGRRARSCPPRPLPWMVLSSKANNALLLNTFIPFASWEKLLIKAKVYHYLGSLLGCCA